LFWVWKFELNGSDLKLGFENGGEGKSEEEEKKRRRQHAKAKRKTNAI